MLVSQLKTFNTLTVLFYRTADQVYNCRGLNKPNTVEERRGEKVSKRETEERKECNRGQRA